MHKDSNNLINDADQKATNQDEPITLIMEHMGFNFMFHKQAFVNSVAWTEEEAT